MKTMFNAYLLAADPAAFVRDGRWRGGGEPESGSSLGRFFLLFSDLVLFVLSPSPVFACCPALRFVAFHYIAFIIGVCAQAAAYPPPRPGPEQRYASYTDPSIATLQPPNRARPASVGLKITGARQPSALCPHNPGGRHVIYAPPQLHLHDPAEDLREALAQGDLLGQW